MSRHRSRVYGGVRGGPRGVASVLWRMARHPLAGLAALGVILASFFSLRPESGDERSRAAAFRDRYLYGHARPTWSWGWYSYILERDGDGFRVVMGPQDSWPSELEGWPSADRVHAGFHRSFEFTGLWALTHFSKSDRITFDTPLSSDDIIAARRAIAEDLQELQVLFRPDVEPLARADVSGTLILWPGVVHSAVVLVAATIAIVSAVHFPAWLRALRARRRGPMRCAACGYSMAGLPALRCPECGHVADGARA